MSCDLTAGRLEPCKSNVGGIDKIYFVDYGDLGAATVGADDEITAFDGTITAYEYEVKSSATSLETSVNSSRDNGTTFFTQTINITLKYLTQAMNKELKLMSYGRPHVIVQDRNGNAWTCGLKRGCEVTGGTIVTGGAMGDLNGYTITLTAEEELPPQSIDGATADDPFATAAPTATIVAGT